MLKLLFIFYVFPSAMFFYSVAYFLRNPADWTGPAILGPISLVFTVITQRIGLKKIRQTPAGNGRTIFIVAQAGGLAGGLAIGVMVYFLLG